MRPQIYEKLAREYDDERRRIENTIQAIQLDKKDYVANLDAALAIIAEIADHSGRLHLILGAESGSNTHFKDATKAVS